MSDISSLSKEEQVRLFLRTMFGADAMCQQYYLSLSVRKGGTKDWKTPPGYSFEELDRAVSFALSMTDYDVYVRMTLTKERQLGGSRGAAIDTAATNVLWTELDTGKEGIDGEVAVQTLLTDERPPSMVVFSGNGYHCYWKLASPLTSVEEIESKNRALRERFRSIGAKDGTFDAARVYRVVCTNNHKYTPKKYVHFVHYDGDRSYYGSDFPDAPSDDRSGAIFIEWKAVDEKSFLPRLKKFEKLWRRIQSEQSAIAEWDKDLTTFNRSDNDHWIASEMIRRRFTEDEIYTTLTHSSWFSGSKHREGTDNRYTELTIEGARRAVAKEMRELADNWVTDKGKCDPFAASRYFQTQEHFRAKGLGMMKSLFRYEPTTGTFKAGGDDFLEKELDQRWGQIGRAHV